MFAKFKRPSISPEKKAEIQKRIDFMNRYSLLFHIILACGVCFLIEWISRHSFVQACYFVIDRNLVFLYNSLIVFSSLMLVYVVRRRAVFRTIISVFWVFLGTINGCILAKRVSPFSFTDLKMVGDLFTMQSNYFTMKETILVIVGVSLILATLVILWFKAPKFQGRAHYGISTLMILAVVMMLPNVTDAAVSNNILTSYFENLAQGYKDYGFVYSFSASVLDRGMSTPEDYSEEAVAAVLQKTQRTASETKDASFEEDSFVRTASAEDEKDSYEKLNIDSTEEKIPEETENLDNDYPNIICVLLESFVDPGLIQFLHTSEDPIPNFHNLYEHYTSGYLEVPVVGAGTANTEFEVLTGMGMQFFGLGEYPYKTILKKTNCESIASDLRTLGYGSHVVHNNGGNFYSRANAFSMMGFDTFTSKELMDIREWTPIGTWPTDDILVGEVQKSLDYTPNQQDFVYTITVESHGDYPKEQVLTDPEIFVDGVEDEGMHYAWEYYVNQIHKVDEFIGELIKMLEKRDEKTIVVMFGDHLPTMDLTEEDMVTGSLFRTQYITWNNFGLEKQDKNMTSYQLLADITSMLGIQNGTMFTFHQNRTNYSDQEEYQKDMEMLQYDILYGDHYVYGGENPYPATDLIMGTQEVFVASVFESADCYYVRGKNFTRWSKIFIDDAKVKTTYINSRLLRFSKEDLKVGFHGIVVSQVGSSETRFRDSNTFYLRKKEKETESQEK